MGAGTGTSGEDVGAGVVGISGEEWKRGCLVDGGDGGAGIKVGLCLMELTFLALKIVRCRSMNLPRE